MFYKTKSDRKCCTFYLWKFENFTFIVTHIKVLDYLKQFRLDSNASNAFVELMYVLYHLIKYESILHDHKQSENEKNLSTKIKKKIS